MKAIINLILFLMIWLTTVLGKRRGGHITFVSVPAQEQKYLSKLLNLGCWIVENRK